MAKNDTIIHNICSLRKERGITQCDMALVLGVSRQTIIAIEGGKHTPSLCLAIKLSRYFGLRVEDIFFLTEID